MQPVDRDHELCRLRRRAAPICALSLHERTDRQRGHPANGVASLGGEWQLTGDDFMTTHFGFWPISDRFAAPNPPFSEMNRGTVGIRGIMAPTSRKRPTTIRQRNWSLHLGTCIGALPTNC